MKKLGLILSLMAVLVSSLTPLDARRCCRRGDRAGRFAAGFITGPAFSSPYNYGWGYYPYGYYGYYPWGSYGYYGGPGAYFYW